MQEYVRKLREMKEEARAGLDRQAEIYARISAELRRAEAIAGRQPNSDNGNGDENGNGGHRDNLVVGPWAAAVGAAAITGKALFGNARRAITTISAAAVVAGGIAFAVTELPSPNRPSPSELLAQPPAAAPPGVHTNPRTGPPRPPKLPSKPPAVPAPIGQPAVSQPSASAAPHPRHTPPRKRPPAVGRPTAPPGDSSAGIGHPASDCRLNLPLLHRGLLCGHPLQRLRAVIRPRI